MIWLPMLLLAGIAVAPLALSMRRAAIERSRRDAAVAWHRSQLAELDRDLAEGRMVPAEHASATLEVQRRLLVAAGTDEITPRPSSRAPLLIALVLVPVAALALYVAGGSPGLPGMPLADRVAAARERARTEGVLL